LDGRPVLVVEDDAAIRATIALALAFEGYAVDAATNGAEAFRAVEARRPSLVVLDLHLPELDGWGFAQALKAAGYDPPILIVTANTTEATKAVVAIGAVGFLAKPFDVSDLLGCVHHFRIP
jgi:DNA-binding response OmpR family regulator